MQSTKSFFKKNINDILEVFAKSCNHSDSKNLIEEILSGIYNEAYQKIPEKRFQYSGDW